MLSTSLATMKWLQPEQGELISSCARHVRLPQPLELGETPQPRAGDVVLARVEEVNPVYPNLEIAEGRDVLLKPGMTLIGALGTRRALHGFSGHVPDVLYIGQSVQLLNKGGVIGECTAFHRDLEWPTLLTYLGSILENGRPLNIRDTALPFTQNALPDIPVVLVLGTCMNSGKTTACNAVIEGFSRRGYTVHAGKVAGVACRRDLLSMERSGARKTASFHDFGLPSSADVESLIPVARSLVCYLAEPRPDFIVLEMGDGILGGYHVSSVLTDREFLDRCMCTVICANDLVGAWGALEYLRQTGIDPKERPTLISGPVTDSGEGVRYIEENFGVPAANPFDSAGKMCSFVLRSWQACMKSA